MTFSINIVDLKALFKCITDSNFFEICISISFLYQKMSPSLAYEKDPIDSVGKPDQGTHLLPTVRRSFFFPFPFIELTF